MNLKCENCGEVEVTADTFVQGKDGKQVPSSGVCPLCKRRIIWANERGEPMEPVSGGLRDMPLPEKKAQAEGPAIKKDGQGGRFSV